MKRFRVVIDRGTCIGVGVCIDVAPRVFVLDGEVSDPEPRQRDG